MRTVAKINYDDDARGTEVEILLEFIKILSDGQHGYLVRLSNEDVTGFSYTPRTEEICLKNIYLAWGHWKTFEWNEDVDLEKFNIPIHTKRKEKFNMIEVARVRKNDDPEKDYIGIMLEFKNVLPNGQHGYIIKYSNEHISGLSPYPATEKECIEKIHRIWSNWKTLEWISDSGLNGKIISTTYLEWNAKTGLTCKLIPTPN